MYSPKLLRAALRLRSVYRARNDMGSCFPSNLIVPPRKVGENDNVSQETYDISYGVHSVETAYKIVRLLS